MIQIIIQRPCEFPTASSSRHSGMGTEGTQAQWLSLELKLTLREITKDFCHIGGEPYIPFNMKCFLNKSYWTESFEISDISDIMHALWSLILYIWLIAWFTQFSEFDLQQKWDSLNIFSKWQILLNRLQRIYYFYVNE